MGVLLTVVVVMSACSDDDGSSAERPRIAIGSFGFDESELLGEIYRQALDDAGYDVEHNARMGARETVVTPALRAGEINFVPEYIGTALEVTFGQEPSSDSESTAEALRAAWSSEGFSVLAYTPAEDKNGFVVTSATAARLGLVRISDLADHAQDLTFGGPPECPSRPRCLAGLGTLYGLTFGDFRPLDAGGDLTVAALETGQIDIALMFTSDGLITAKDFVLLDDDRGLQPAENIAPVVSETLVTAYGPVFVDLVNSISSRITAEELRALNLALGDGETAADVAERWLEANGLG